MKQANLYLFVRFFQAFFQTSVTWRCPQTHIDWYLFWLCSR